MLSTSELLKKMRAGYRLWHPSDGPDTGEWDPICQHMVVPVVIRPEDVSALQAQRLSTIQLRADQEKDKQLKAKFKEMAESQVKAKGAQTQLYSAVVADRLRFKSKDDPEIPIVTFWPSLSYSGNAHLEERVRVHPAYETLYQRVKALSVDTIKAELDRNIKNSNDPTERLICQKVLSIKQQQHHWLFFNNGKIEVMTGPKPAGTQLYNNYFDLGADKKHQLVWYKSTDIREFYGINGYSEKVSLMTPYAAATREKMMETYPKPQQSNNNAKPT